MSIESNPDFYWHASRFAAQSSQVSVLMFTAFMSCFHRSLNQRCGMTHGLTPFTNSPLSGSLEMLPSSMCVTCQSQGIMHCFKRVIIERSCALSSVALFVTLSFQSVACEIHWCPVMISLIIEPDSRMIWKYYNKTFTQSLRIRLVIDRGHYIHMNASINDNTVSLE